MSIDIRTFQWNQEMRDFGLCSICKEDLLDQDSTYLVATIPSFQGHDVSTSTGVHIYHLMHEERVEGLLATSCKCALCNGLITHIEGAPAPDLEIQDPTQQQQLLHTQAIEDEEDSLLIRAALAGDLESVTELLSTRDINLSQENESSQTSLMIAASRGHAAIASILAISNYLRGLWLI